MNTDIETGSVILDFIINNPVLPNLFFVLLNITIYGFNGFLGGYFPFIVKLSVGTFMTIRKFAYNSECITRIVQQKYFYGQKLPDEVRREILEKFGPRKGNGIKCHYKNVLKSAK